MENSYTITKQMYRSLLPAQVLMALIPDLAGLAASLVAGNFIEGEALAVIGFILPFTIVVTAISQVLTVGTSVVLGECIGRGSYKRTDSIYTTMVTAAVASSLVIMAVVFLFTKQILLLMGLTEALLPTAVPYFRVAALGYLPNILLPVLIVFISMRDNIAYPTIVTAVIAVSNIALALCFVLLLSRELVLIGLASSLSYYIGLFMLLIKLKKDPDTAAFQLHRFDVQTIRGALTSGLPTFVTKLGVCIRLALINRTALAVAGIDAVTGVTVMNNSVLFVTAAYAGALSTDRFLASIAAGEGDIHGLKNTIKALLRIALPLCVLVDLLYGVFSVPIASAFGVSGDALHYSSLCMSLYAIAAFFEIFFFDINGVYLIILKKIKYSVLLSVLINYLLPALMCLAGKTFSSVALVYLAYSVPVVVSLGVIVVYSSIKNGHLPREPFDLLRPVPELDSAVANIYVTTVTDEASALRVSENIIDFCIKAGADRKKAYYAGLCAEEMSVNFITHGVRKTPGKKHLTLDILVNVLGDEIRLRLRDNASAFNPVRRLELAKSADSDPCANIGIKIVSGIAKSMDYKQNFNMNVTNIVL